MTPSRDLFVAAAVACLQLIAQASAQAAPPPAFDCNPAMEAVMTPGWKAWCCLNEQVGCPPTSTTTSSSTTRTTTSSITTTSSSTTWSPEKWCKQECTHVNITATCGNWLLWASEDAAHAEKNFCAAAQMLVIMQCSGACNGCTAQAAGCKDDVKLEPMFFKKKFEQPTMSHALPHEAILLPPGLATVLLGVAGLSLVTGGVALVVSGLRLRSGGRTVQISWVDQQGLIEEAAEEAC